MVIPEARGTAGFALMTRRLEIRGRLGNDQSTGRRIPMTRSTIFWNNRDEHLATKDDGISVSTNSETNRVLGRKRRPFLDDGIPPLYARSRNEGTNDRSGLFSRLRCRPIRSWQTVPSQLRPKSSMKRDSGTCRILERRWSGRQEIYSR